MIGMMRWFVQVRCWYDMSSSAAELLGHLPGVGGEGEAYATLLAVKTCLAQECAPVCGVQ